MKKNIKKIMVAVCLCFVASAVSAQTYNEKKKLFVAKMTQQLKDSLTLNDDQIKKIQAISDKYQPEFTAVAQNSSLDAEGKKKQYFEVYQKKRSELKEIITGPQINKMEAMEKKAKKEIGL